jgi:pimeloyl-ACP methyl ester carboxylesterase
MGGITAIAAAVILGDGRLAAADRDLDAAADAHAAPTPRIVGVVGDAVTPELWIVVANRARFPFGRLLAERAFARLGRDLGGDPRATQPIDMVGLLEDVPLLLIHGDADTTVPIAEGRRLAAASPAGTRHLVVPGAGHAAAHATDPSGYDDEVTSFLRVAFGAARN